jgi:ribosomal protein L7/L12
MRRLAVGLLASKLSRLYVAVSAITNLHLEEAMILNISESDRRHIVRALAMFAEDLRKISESVISPYLQREFETDARNVNSLAGRAAGLAEQLDEVTLNAAVLNLMRGGRKIDAIKLIRDNRALGLKDSKDYAEKIEREAA